MKTSKWIAFAVLVVVLVCPGTGAQSAPLTKDAVPVLVGAWYYRARAISVNGHIYSAYAYSGNYHSATFDIRGWDQFITWVGILDEDSYKDGSLTVTVDGESVKSVSVSKGQPVAKVVVSLSGHQTMTIGYDHGARLIEPVVLKGGSSVTSDEPPGAESTTQSSRFVVDPKDVSALAAKLAKQVRESGSTSQMQIAVAKFKLIPKSLDPSVSDAVLEDLSTALIETKAFKLVERSQLDRALEELKLQESGVIDSATAQKLGRMVGAKAVMIGSISDRGKFGVINARLINTETGESDIAANVETRK